MLNKAVRNFASKGAKGSLGKQQSLGANFSFPRHKELFNEGYYDEEKDINDTFKSPFSQDQNLSEEGSGLDIEGGILQNYKKVSGQTVEEIMEGDFFRAKRDLQKSAANFFNLSTSNEKDMMNATKNFTMRHRLNKDLDFTDDFRKKFITKEYGNYEKYDQN